MLDGAVVVDAVVHRYNLEPANQNPPSSNQLEAVYGAHVAMGLVDEISYDDGDVRIVLVLTDASCVHFTGLRRYIGDVIGLMPGVDSMTVTASTTEIWTQDRRTTTVEQTIVPTDHHPEGRVQWR